MGIRTGRGWIFAVAGGAVAGLLIASLLIGKLPFAGATASRAKLQKVTYYAALRDDLANLSLVPRVQPSIGEANGLDSGTPRDFVVWNERRFHGRVDRDAVASIVAAGHAEALLSHLAPEAQAELRASLEDIDATLCEVAKLARLEVRNTKEHLLERPDRLIEITTHPRERDPDYPKLLDARREIESKQKGAIWGDVIDGREIHFVIRWDEWPLLKALYDEQRDWVVARSEHIRLWIERRFTVRGMKLFSKS